MCNAIYIVLEITFFKLNFTIYARTTKLFGFKTLIKISLPLMTSQNSAFWDRNLFIVTLTFADLSKWEDVEKNLIFF